MEKFDDLWHFANWWITTKTLNPPVDNITQDEHYTGTVLYRDGPYQVELFTIKPNAKGVSHIHPNVDSYEYHVNGEYSFEINGVLVNVKENDPPRLSRIYPNYWHNGNVSEKGGSFLSIQKWLNGVSPTSVTLDWHDANGNKLVNWN